jgi:hypothetical protein
MFPEFCIAAASVILFCWYQFVSFCYNPGIPFATKLSFDIGTCVRFDSIKCMDELNLKKQMKS